MENDGKKRFRFGVQGKLLISIILLAVTLGAVCTMSGYYRYQNTIRRMYNENGYMIGNLILEQIDHDKIAEYTRTWTEDEDYEMIRNNITRVAETTGAAYIYIVTVNEDQTVRYVFDSSGVPLGAVDPVSAYFDEVWAAYTEGKRTDNYMVRKSPRYGYLTSSMLPVTDSSGRVAALLFVDVWMQEIVSNLQEYMVRSILSSLVILAVFIVFHWIRMRRSFVDPLMRIGENVTEFAQTGTANVKPLEDIRTNDEIQDLAQSIARMETDIVSYIDDLQRITAEKERIGAELSVATRIQADMLPRIFPPYPDRGEFDVYATMTPAKEVGGDFYDFFMLDDDRLGLVMADVSGKGVPAALFMVITKTLIKNRAQMGGGPAEILRDVNDQLCEGNDADMFVTVWFAILDVKTGKGVAANAGHEHPAVSRAGGKYELAVYRHTPVLGVIPGTRVTEHEFELHPGDSLFVYTDGVVEATDATGRLFGTNRMLTALNRNPGASPEDALRAVRTDIDNFVGDAAQFDDLTMLCLHFTGSGAAEQI